MAAPTTVARPVPVERIAVGPQTRERAARVLEQQLGAVWAGILESHGYDAEAGWRLIVDELTLVPPQPGPPTGETNGRA